MQSMRAYTILFLFTVIYSMSWLFTALNVDVDVFICNYHLVSVVHSGSIGAFKF